MSVVCDDDGRNMVLHVLLLLVVSVPLAACNHYATLGVKRGASASDIKAAYRKLALEHHPDKCREPSKQEQSVERFKQITDAYQCLIDPRKRRIYDLGGYASTEQRGQPSGGMPAGFGFPPGFGAAFQPGSGGSFQGSGSPMVLSRAHREFYCSLDEIESGCRRSVSLKDDSLQRLRDAVDERFTGASGQALLRTATLALSLVWRMPTLLFGRRLWLRLPLLALAFAATLAHQLPPSPSGTFDFDVQPGWRAGTKVVFGDRSHSGERPVAFVLREARHPTLARKRADLYYHTTTSRRAAAAVSTRKKDGTHQPWAPCDPRAHQPRALGDPRAHHQPHVSTCLAVVIALAMAIAWLWSLPGRGR